jgi:Sensors of blue-light using FAD
LYARARPRGHSIVHFLPPRIGRATRQHWQEDSLFRRLGFLSLPRADLPGAELPRIIARSRINNARDEISGVLVYSGTDFVQLIEGPPTAVGALWARIRADPRHHDILVFVDTRDPTRWCNDWRVGYLDNLALVRQIADWRTLQRPWDAGDQNSFRRLLAAANPV